MPCAASTTRSAPSHACRERETSYVKSTWPGVSIRLSSWPFHETRTAWALIVMPRSRSRSIESSSCSRISRAETASVISRMRSASVDLPWSMCAMIEKLRILLWSMGQSDGTRHPREHPARRQAKTGLSLPGSRFGWRGRSRLPVHAPRCCLGGCARGADAEGGTQLDLGVTDFLERELVGEVLSDPAGYRFASRLGLAAGVPRAHREHLVVSDRDRVALEP